MSAGNEAERLNGLVLDRYRRVCVRYHSTDEAFRVQRPFIAVSFKKGGKAFHILPGVADLAGTPGAARVSPGHGPRRLRRCHQREE